MFAMAGHLHLSYPTSQCKQKEDELSKCLPIVSCHVTFHITPKHNLKQVSGFKYSQKENNEVVGELRSEQV